MSCNDVDLLNISKDVQIDESLVLPLAEGSITIEDILNQLDLQNQIAIDADTINFVAEINKEYQFDDVNLLKDAVEKITDLPLPVAAVLADTEMPIVGTNEFQLDLGLDPSSTTNRFDSVRVSTATFGLTLSVTDIKVLSSNLGISPSDLKITIVFPKMKYFNSKDPISKDVTINEFGQMSSFEVVNFVGDTDGMTGVPFQIKFKSGNRDIKIGTSGKINIGFKINQLVYQVAYGRFELTTPAGTTVKTPLDILSELPEGIRLANPKVLIKVESNIGAFLRFNIESLKAFSKDASVVPVDAIFDNGLKSTYEIIGKPSAPGLFSTTNMKTIDRINGTTDKLIDTSLKLDSLEFKFSFQTDDALNNASSSPRFIIPGMKMKANVKIQVPLHLKEGSNISMSDTLKDVDLDVIENIEKAILVLKVTNSLPAKVSYSMKFLNATNAVITSSINDNTYVINSGNVDNNGLVTSPTITPINIELTKEQATQLKDAKSMIYTFKVEGQDATKQIQFTKNNYIKVKLGAFVNGSYSTTLGSNN